MRRSFAEEFLFGRFFQRQLIMDFLVFLLPFVLGPLSHESWKASIFGFLGFFAAFRLGALVLQLLKGIGFWISRAFCCLWSWDPCSAILERHRFLVFSGFLLPFVLGLLSFNSWKASIFGFLGFFAAFCPEAHVRQFLKGIDFWISRAFCCLSS